MHTLLVRTISDKLWKGDIINGYSNSTGGHYSERWTVNCSAIANACKLVWRAGTGARHKLFRTIFNLLWRKSWTKNMKIRSIVDWTIDGFYRPNVIIDGFYRPNLLIDGFYRLNLLINSFYWPILLIDDFYRPIFDQKFYWPLLLIDRFCYGSC